MAEYDWEYDREELQGPSQRSNFSREVLIPECTKRHIIGVHGRFIKTLYDISGIDSIEFIHQHLPTSSLLIQGRSMEAVENVECRVLDKLSNYFYFANNSKVTRSVRFPEDAILSDVIGLKGAHIRKLKSQSDIDYVYVDQEKRTIKIGGRTLDAVASVQSQIEAKIAEKVGVIKQVAFELPPALKYHDLEFDGFLQKLKKSPEIISIDYINELHSSTRSLLIKGRSIESVENVKSKVISKLSHHFFECDNSNFKRVIFLSSGAIGHVIGTKGSHIRKLRELPNIDYVRIDNETRTVNIGGKTLDAVEKTHSLITEKLNEKIRNIVEVEIPSAAKDSIYGPLGVYLHILTSSESKVHYAVDEDTLIKVGGWSVTKIEEALEGIRSKISDHFFLENCSKKTCDMQIPSGFEEGLQLSVYRSFRGIDYVKLVEDKLYIGGMDECRLDVVKNAVQRDIDMQVFEKSKVKCTVYILTKTRKQRAGTFKSLVLEEIRMKADIECAFYEDDGKYNTVLLMVGAKNDDAINCVVPIIQDKIILSMSKKAKSKKAQPVITTLNCPPELQNDIMENLNKIQSSSKAQYVIFVKGKLVVCSTDDNTHSASEELLKDHVALVIRSCCSS